MGKGKEGRERVGDGRDKYWKENGDGEEKGVG